VLLFHQISLLKGANVSDMLPKSIERLAQKLNQKKQRYLHKLFVAEGEKTISDLLREGFVAQHLLSNDDRFSSEQNYLRISDADFQRISKLDTADGTLAIFPFPSLQTSENTLTLVLDNIRIPGNLGTIIRTADWFGIKQIYCTTGTTDAFNAKAVQSSMGSIGRVQITYASAEGILDALQHHTLLVADMEGKDIKDFTPDPHRKLALVMGSESHGPSAVFTKSATALTIPRKGDSMIESLNVGIATAILLHQLA
jgi:TrmH family RNA methyltransferase